MCTELWTFTSLGIAAPAKKTARTMCRPQSRTVCLVLHERPERLTGLVLDINDLPFGISVIPRGWSACRGQCLEQCIEPIAGVAQSALHAGSDHRIAIIDRLEAGHRAEQGLAFAFLEGGRVELHVTWGALVLERLHDPGDRGLSVEDPVEAVLVASRVPIHVAPRATVVRFVAIDGERQVARA